MILHRIYLDQEGLGMFLGGKLQASVYTFVAHNPSTLREIHTHLVNNYGNVTLTTAATVANKLVGKSILDRRRRTTSLLHGRGVFLYSVAILPDALVNDVLDRFALAISLHFPEKLALLAMYTDKYNAAYNE